MNIKKVLGSAVLAAAGGQVNAAENPNIIYINADDLGVMDVHFMGRPEYNTPNLDKLAAEGMVFMNAYAPAANCAPSRACCMSGQYAPRHGIYTVNSSTRGKSRDRKLIPIKNKTVLPDENITMAEALKAAGYKTIHLGKWHLGKDPRTQGFDINIGGNHAGGPYGGGYFSPFTDAMKPFSDKYPEGTHRADIFADQAIKFMDANKDRPFFMYMAYYSVHSRLQPVPEFVDKYKKVKGINPAYASMVEKMDQSIGKIVAEVDRLGLKEKTMILFTSDNGGVYQFSKQTPYRAGKGSYFEGGIREPMLVRWPGKVEAGSKCDVPVIGIDFYPTFLAVAGAPVPKGKILDGVNLMPLLTQSGAIAERALFWHFPIYLEGNNDSHDKLFRTRPGTVMRFGKWKLHEYFEEGRLELYDLSKDIGERKNIAKSMPEKTAEMHRMMEAWRQDVNAPVPTELNPGYNPTGIDDKTRAKKPKLRRK